MCLDSTKKTKIIGGPPILAFRRMEIKKLKVGKGLTHVNSVYQPAKFIIDKNGRADWAQMSSNSANDYGYHSSHAPNRSIRGNQWLVIIPPFYFLYTDGKDITSTSFWLPTLMPTIQAIPFLDIARIMSLINLSKAKSVYVHEDSVIARYDSENDVLPIINHTKLSDLLPFIDPRQRLLLEKGGL